jgi:hypothetical protein
MILLFICFEFQLVSVLLGCVDDLRRLIVLEVEAMALKDSWPIGGMISLGCSVS